MGNTSLKVEMMVKYIKEKEELLAVSIPVLRVFLQHKFKCSKYLANQVIKKLFEDKDE